MVLYLLTLFDRYTRRACCQHQLSFLFDGHDELYRHAKFGEDRTTRAGCMCENVIFFCYRQDAAKRQTAGIKFTHRPKIRFFAPQGRLAAPIHIKLCRADAGGNAAAKKYKKFPLFGK